MIVVWLFLAVPWLCLQFVVVVFPNHIHLLFFSQLMVLVVQEASSDQEWTVPILLNVLPDHHLHMCIFEYQYIVQ